MKEPRQQLLKLQNDNKRLKSEIDRSYKLQQAAGERLATETKDLEIKNTNYKCTLPVTTKTTRKTNFSRKNQKMSYVQLIF